VFICIVTDRFWWGAEQIIMDTLRGLPNAVTGYEDTFLDSKLKEIAESALKKAMGF
jgi:hypothetical protein